MPHILDIGLHSILPFIAVISIVVFVHEYGHYWIAKRCGVKIEIFSIGFGREIFGWNDKHGTRWKVSWLPLGGYVKMYGDGSVASTPDASVHTMAEEEKRVSFYHQHVDKRIAVVIAGPATNYLFAILILAFLFVFQGQPYTSTHVSTVVEKSVAEKAGLHKGDYVLSVDGQNVTCFEDIQKIISLNPGMTIPIEVDRDGQHIHLTVVPQTVAITDSFGGEHSVGRIGIASEEHAYRKWPPLKAVTQAAAEVWNITAMTLHAIGQMIIGVRGSQEVGGLLSIANVSQNAVKDGVPSFLYAIAFISVNLGLINLFPIPPLDGGHLVFYIIERLKGRPVQERLQAIGMNVGLVLVIGLMIFGNLNDLFRYHIISHIREWFS